MATKSAPKLKLTYFNGRGRAEPNRLMFAYAGQKFEDIRLEQADWPGHKDKTPWKSLPTLEVDGQVIGQSLAISRYVAKITKLQEGTPYELAKMDEVVDACKELQDKWGAYAFAPDDVKEQKKKELEDILSTIFTTLEKQLGSKDYFGGKKVCWADFHYFNISDIYRDTGFGSTLEKFKKLDALTKRVGALKNVKEYLAKRKQTPF